MSFLKFEHKTEGVLPWPKFIKRSLRFAGYSVVILFVSLGIGVAGYHCIAKLNWIDSLLNASMILTGMGPVAPLSGVAAKVFASAYALFSGIAFLSTVAILFAPAAHRMLHFLHMDEE